MVRVNSTAAVDDWLHTVAKVLPLSHREAPPYSLGEAVAELGAYSQAIGAIQRGQNWASEDE